jgi:CHAD domain-containing protein
MSSAATTTTNAGTTNKGRPTLVPAAGMAGQFLIANLTSFDAKLGETVPRVIATGDDEAVHDFRVALRRTRVLLEVGRSVFGRFYANEVRGALRDVMRASGALRDEEVLLETLGSLGIRRPDLQEWIESRGRRERRLRNALRRKIREGEVDRGRRLLHALVAFRTKPSRDRRVTKFARRAMEDAQREVDRRRSGPLDTPESLHELRIAYKRLRYTAETFASVLPVDLASVVQVASRWQSRLGKLHDLDVAILCVKAARSLPDVARDLVLAELERQRTERAASITLELGGLGAARAAAAKSQPPPVARASGTSQ